MTTDSVIQCAGTVIIVSLAVILAASVPIMLWVFLGSVYNEATRGYRKWRRK